MDRCYMIILLGLLLLIEQCFALTKPTSIKLENNEYTGVLFAIHPDVPEDPQLIEEIQQRMIIDASPYLYKATRNRAFFKSVTILIPQTWEDKAIYQSPKNATFEKADVIIAEKNPRYNPEEIFPASPYCKHFEGCGKQSAYIHFTPDYLTHPHTELFFGNKGRILVHEWGHYRWGLFNEYADEIADPDESQEFYFSQQKNKWVPTRCADDWISYNLVYDPKMKRYRYCVGNENVGYEDGCVSIPMPSQSRVTASIMYGYTSVPEIVDFCDSDPADPSIRHNPEVPNKHNRLCDTKSNWQVMMEHEDFKDGNNGPREIDDVTPTIILARVKQQRTVLVLDTSSSMKGHLRMKKLATTARNFLTSLDSNGNAVGIVSFSQTGKILSPLVNLTSDEAKRSLAELIPTTTTSGTCIGCGLEKALEILSDGDADPAGGEIILVTDGVDAYPARTQNMKDQYIREGVIINAVAFSNSASATCIDLQQSTGGRLWFQADNPGSTGLHDAFLATMQAGTTTAYEKRIELTSSSRLLEINEVISYGVFIDDTLGRKTTFTFSYYVDSELPVVSVIITGPSGEVFDKSYQGYGIDSTFKVIQVIIPRTESGLWQVLVTNIYNGRLEVLMSVSSFASDENVEPIIATAELSGSLTDFANGQPLIAFAEIRQGFKPIINANVTAIIERPADNRDNSYPPVKLQLLDNGAGADVTRDDGIYSRYFTEFTGVGYYGIKLSINNDNKEALILQTIDSEAPYSRTLASTDPDQLLKGNLPKVGDQHIPLPGMPTPKPSYEEAPNFSRSVSGGSSRVKDTPENWKVGDDITGPVKITDLTITATSYTEGTVSLTFTAPGDDLDHGKASFYVIRYSDSTSVFIDDVANTTLVTNDDILKGNLSSPAPFGNRESFVVRVPVRRDSQTVAFSIAINAVDDVGNVGAMSNVAHASLRQFVPEAPSSSTTMGSSVSGSEGSVTGVVVIIAMLIVIGTVVTVILVHLFKKKGHEK
ncbi:Calcium-activated chloride channel regulator 1 [Holothuria leucospilota]|uniref:Calcium-activated chloride channel regulator 1 n=1 Tax=Holothuria leucospilota TaxID=206669 RepID=A0A9Q0YLX5_HOLLE|nr:Calcium-activated chloride channel regulator 1 [Holothuria leucospilota]